jgi:DNA-binding SARP family transcriptional activator
MDIYKALRELYQQKERLDKAIASLEQIQSAGATEGKISRRRGRKSMDEDERRQVSERMKKYWASRRKGHEEGTADRAR